jgi:hypothetical protein
VLLGASASDPSWRAPARAIDDPTPRRRSYNPASAAVAGGRDFSLWCVPGRSDTVRVTVVSVR